MAKRKPMAAIPDFGNINQAAGNSKESIDKLESNKDKAKNWSSSTKPKAVTQKESTTKELSPKPAKQKSRVGRVPIQGYFSEITRDRLKFLALRDKTTVESLMNEAFEMYFEENKDKFKGIPHLES